MKVTHRTALWLIPLLAALFFFPGLGQVHLFDWDEINFAESAREMIASGEWGIVQINYQPFWEKPPCLSGFRRWPCPYWEENMQPDFPMLW